jgi:hypothetical protein
LINKKSPRILALWDLSRINPASGGSTQIPEYKALDSRLRGNDLEGEGMTNCSGIFQIVSKLGLVVEYFQNVW